MYFSFDTMDGMTSHGNPSLLPGKVCRPNHPWEMEILAPDGGSGSEVINEGLEIQTIEGQ